MFKHRFVVLLLLTLVASILSVEAQSGVFGLQVQTDLSVCGLGDVVHIFVLLQMEADVVLFIQEPFQASDRTLISTHLRPGRQGYTYTVGDFPDAAGTYTVKAKASSSVVVDVEWASTTFRVEAGGQPPPQQAWSFDVAPTVATASPGGVAEFSVYVFGSGQRIRLSVAQSYQFSFSPNDERAPYTSILRIQVDPSKPAGTYGVTIIGNNLDDPFQQYSMTVQLNVVGGGGGGQFTIDVRTDRLTYNIGDPVTVEFRVTDKAEQGVRVVIRRGNDPNQEVYFDIVNNPTPNVWYTLVATGATLSLGTYTVGADALNLAGVNPSAQTTYAVVSGGAGGFDFTLQLSPTQVTVKPGETGNYQILVTYSDPSQAGTAINIQITGLGPGMNYHLTQNGALTVTTSPTTPQGTYTLTVIGSAQGVTRQTTGILLVTSQTATTTHTTTSQTPEALGDFIILPSPLLASILPGESATFTVTIEKIGDFSQPVRFTRVSGHPPESTPDLRPEEGIPNFTAILRIETPESTQPGTYLITVEAQGGGKTRSTILTMIIKEKTQGTGRSTTAIEMETQTASTGFNVSALLSDPTYLFIIAVAVIATALVARSLRKRMKSSAGPPCTTCGKPTTYIKQYQRYYCHDCQKYT